MRKESAGVEWVSDGRKRECVRVCVCDGVLTAFLSEARRKGRGRIRVSEVDSPLLSQM